MATLTKPIVAKPPTPRQLNTRFKPTATTRATNTSMSDMAKDVSQMNRKANKRIKNLAEQGVYSYALEARYRKVHNTHRDTKVDYSKVLKEAESGLLNFRMPESKKIGFKGAVYKYDQKGMYRASNDVYTFLESKTSTKTGIVEWLTDLKSKFRFDPTGEFNSLPVDEQVYSLKEAFRYLDEVEKYMKETGDILSDSERYKLTEFMADEISKGGFNTSTMSIDELTEFLKKTASELTADQSVFTPFTFGGKTYDF